MRGKRPGDCIDDPRNAARKTNMDPLLISAASGMKARMESLDMLANNISNVNTSGFKADREFYNLYQQQLPLIESRWTDFSQGSLVATGNPLNLALSGQGFFALTTPSGTAYTRSGNFEISKSNQLATAEGYTLRNVLDQGKPITVDPTQSIAIDKAGVVSQGGQPVGQIEVAQIPSAASAISKMGSNYFALSGPPPVTAATSTLAAPEVLQGNLEQSNVGVADQTVRLISVMRQFEMLQRAINTGTQMNKLAIQEVAKIG